MEALSAIFRPIGAVFNAIVHPFIIIYLNLLMVCYLLLSNLQFPYAFGFSIILSTLVIKLVTYPLNSKQLKHAQKMIKLNPQMSKIRQLHKGDNKRIMEEQRKLFQENGISQAAGCLPLLIQLPIFFGLYNVLTNVVKHQSLDQVNYINSIVIDPLRLDKPIDLSFFGISLGQNPGQLLPVLGISIALIPIFTAVLTFIQSKMAMPIPVKEYESDSGKEKAEKRENADMSQVMQSQMTYMMPFLIGIMSFTFPVGLSIYWITFTIFGIIQQYKISGLGGVEPLWQKIRRQ